jgi:hypothetical protein
MGMVWRYWRVVVFPLTLMQSMRRSGQLFSTEQASVAVAARARCSAHGVNAPCGRQQGVEIFGPHTVAFRLMPPCMEPTSGDIQNPAQHQNGMIAGMGRLDLSRFRAAPGARLSHLSFEGDWAFPAQC